MQPAIPDVVAKTRGILKDAGAEEFDAQALRRAIDYAQTHLALGTRLTMKRHNFGNQYERVVRVPDDLLDLDSVYLVFFTPIIEV